MTRHPPGAAGDDVDGPADDTFHLYDLRVEIVAVKHGLEAICNHRIGDAFEVSGEELRIVGGGSFSMYALAAVLPLLPAKQRPTHPNDWMSSDDLVMCPDPQCEAVMRITRLGLRAFRRSAVTATPRHDAVRGGGDVGAPEADEVG